MNTINQTLQKLIVLCIFIVLSTTTLWSQVTIGSAYKPSNAALLDLKEEEVLDGGANSELGLGMPRVSLGSLSELKPMLTGNESDYAAQKIANKGLTVYNVNTTTPFQEGIYTWNGTQWLKSSSISVANGLTMTNDVVELGGTITTSKSITLATGKILKFIGDGTNANSNTNVEINGQKSFKYVDGNQANGKLLVSDGYGNGSWKTALDAGLVAGGTNGLSKVGANIELGGWAQTPLALTSARGITTTSANYLEITGSAATDGGLRTNSLRVSGIGQTPGNGKVLVSDADGNASWLNSTKQVSNPLPMAIDAQTGEVGTSATSKPSLVAFFQSSDEQRFGDKEKLILNNISSNTTAPIIVTFSPSDMIMNNIGTWNDALDELTITNAGTYEVSGFVNYVVNATFPATYPTDYNKFRAALNVSVEISTDGGNTFNPFVTARSIWTAGTLQNTSQTINVPPGVGQFAVGTRLRMVVSRPPRLDVGIPFGLDHGTWGSYFGITLPTGVKFTKGFKIIALN